MTKAALARVKIGVNTKTFASVYYLEARTEPKRPWRMVASKGEWFTTKSRKVADREAADLDKRLRAKLNS